MENIYNSDKNPLLVNANSSKSGSSTTNQIVWNAPHVSVNNGEKLKLMKFLEKEKSLFILFQTFKTYKNPELGT